MPSSLIFAGLAMAWLVVLVPMAAKRRQEVLRTTESALASRVLHRPEPGGEHDEEVPAMTERAHDAGGRPFRPGRGGYDPEAAALAARAKYAFRQRVVLALLLSVAATLVLALVSAPMFWWAHGGVDVALVGYLGYLRRQVRIEEEVRRRRADRLAAGRRRRRPAQDPQPDLPAQDDEEALDARDVEPVEEKFQAPPAPTAPAAPPVRPGAVTVDLDDEDPVFDELEPAFEPPYRRAAGE